MFDVNKHRFRTLSTGLMLGAIAFQAKFSTLAYAVDEITIPISGVIENSCAVETASSTVNLGELSNAGSLQFPITLRCNAPFSYTMVSQNGGLSLQNPEAIRVIVGSQPFADFVSYSLSSNIPTDIGTIADTCTSNAIKTGVETCVFTDSGTGVALPSTAQFELAWQEQAIQLLSGTYTDQLTLTFAVRP